MTNQELKTILSMVAVNYHTFQVVPNVTEQLWMRCLGDYQAKLIEAAVLAHVMTSKFPPTLADIAEQVQAIQASPDDQLSAGEAWGLVGKAVSKFGAWNEAGALEWLPSRAAAAVRGIGWQQICASTQPSVERAHFLKTYEQISAREAKEAKLSPSVKKTIDAANKSVTELLNQTTHNVKGLD